MDEDDDPAELCDDRRRGADRGVVILVFFGAGYLFGRCSSSPLAGYCPR